MNEIVFLAIAAAATLFKVGAIVLGVIWAMKSTFDIRTVQPINFDNPLRQSWLRRLKGR